MATPAELAQIRLLIAEPTNAEPYTDEVLGDLILASEGSVRNAAAAIWRAKAASVAHLVDVSEGGSSRKMSDLYRNALAMAASFSQDLPAEASASRVSRSRAIERT